MPFSPLLFSFSFLSSFFFLFLTFRTSVSLSQPAVGHREMGQTGSRESCDLWALPQHLSYQHSCKISGDMKRFDPTEHREVRGRDAY